MSNVAVIQFSRREVFERNVTRALGAGAFAGMIAFATPSFHWPLPLLALIGTSLAFVRGDRVDQSLLTVLSFSLPTIPWLLGLSFEWTVALTGAICGTLMVKATVAERGEEGSVGAERPGAMHYVAGAVATGILSVIGTSVAQTIATRLLMFSAPAFFSFALNGLVIALFAGIGSLASHLALKADPIEARCEALIPLLAEEFATQIKRALMLYRFAGTQLAALPRDAAREELARTLQKLTQDAAELAFEWAGVETQMHHSADADLKHEIEKLMISAAQSRDAPARQQLELAARSLEEELVTLDQLRLKRERVLARLQSQVALLERARVALLGMRSTHATVRAAEMSSVSRKLEALAQQQSDLAQLGHEVATGKELTARA